MTERETTRTRRRWKSRLVFLCTILALLSGCVTAPSPTESPALPEDTDSRLAYDPAAKAALDAQWKQIEAQYPGVQKPDVAIVRFVSPEDAVNLLDACLDDEGFPDVSVTPDGNLDSGKIPTAQQGAYAVSMWVCMARYPYEAKYNAELTTDQLGALYHYYVDELTPCLEAEGYSVDDPPSEVTFIDKYYSASDLWNPYADVSPASEGQWDSVNEVCPQSPDNLFG